MTKLEQHTTKNTLDIKLVGHFLCFLTMVQLFFLTADVTSHGQKASEHDASATKTIKKKYRKAEDVLSDRKQQQLP